MTKKLQNKILNQLYFLKSIGYDYSENINIYQANNKQEELPNNIDELKEIAENCYLCQLSKFRENVLFGQGNNNANIMFIKESPTISEDEMATFYVGKAGELLQKMIQNVLNISQNDVYITNVVKCICTNGTITKEHVNYCKSYLYKQIELIKPKIVVALGESVYTYLTNDSTNFTEIRGKVINQKDFDIICTYEPGFLLRNPSSKKEAYQDMLQIKSLMEKM